MTIGDLKAWIKTLPEEFDDMSVVFRKYDAAKPEKTDDSEEGEVDEYYYAIDAPISSGFIDQESREFCLLDEKSRTFIVKMNEELSKGNTSEEK